MQLSRSSGSLCHDGVSGREMAEPPLHKPTVENVAVAAVWSVFADYGWFILFGLIAIYMLVQKVPRKFREHRSDPPAFEADAVARREEAMMAARQKMQDEIDAQAAIFREKQREREEEKRRQKITKWENMKEGKSSKMPLGQNPAVTTPSLEKVAGPVRGDRDAEVLRQVDDANLAGVCHRHRLA
uniref:Uncharacterized protein n=1 Tax=Sphaerodactylus townsendi TaxID=933632 RepID=A0ACB8E6I5_9SAUR